ncbi:hypothetical protein GS610_08070 [Ruegeria sp. HKCCD6228]|uniref:hypothetical protein n=1 Tax=Ruegeria sp. HKCCD6228 TaxID=2683001 RepID=UPI0014913B53|nr:hypothetical protein [Ruegeria sp. HKCCD6228]NOD97163.1 hypothetical protein [Ruegeria sp. HKCCD6228]
MNFVRALVASAVFLLVFSSAEAQTVEDCAAITDKEVRQECFNAAFANKADPTSDATEENELFSEEQAKEDMAVLLEILTAQSDANWHQFAEAYSTCWLSIGSIRVNVFRREMYRSLYELRLGDLSSADLHSQMKPNDTVKVTTKRSNPVPLDSKVYSQDGQTLIADRSEPVRQIFLNPNDKADIPELLEIVQRGIQRCQGQEKQNYLFGSTTPLIVAGFFTIDSDKASSYILLHDNCSMDYVRANNQEGTSRIWSIELANIDLNSVEMQGDHSVRFSSKRGAQILTKDKNAQHQFTDGETKSVSMKLAPNAKQDDALGLLKVWLQTCQS